MALNVISLVYLNQICYSWPSGGNRWQEGEDERIAHLFTIKFHLPPMNCVFESNLLHPFTICLRNLSVCFHLCSSFIGIFCLFYMQLLCLTLQVSSWPVETFAYVKNRWEKSSWGRKLIVQKRRAALNEIDRFKIMLAKIQVSVHLCFTATSDPLSAILGR